MKKTILATVIASASFGVLATDLGVPTIEPIEVPLAEKVEMANQAFEKLGVNASLEIDKNGQVHYTFNNATTGEQRTVTLSNMSEDQIQTVKDATKQGVKDSLVGIDPQDPELGVDPIEDFIPVEPIQPIAGNPDAIREYATEAGKSKLDNFKKNATDSEKANAMATVAENNGYDFNAYENANGDVVLTLTDKETGEQVGFTEEQFKEHMTAKQAERAAERKVEDEMPIGGEHGTKVRNAVEKLAESGQNLKESGENLRQSGVVAAATLEELEAGQMFLFNEVDRLDSKIDGVAAMNQAALAARPYLSSDQTSSFGVGVGGAGSEGAVALGYAHRINANWTANANVAYNTGDSAEASYGAGVSYAW
ncbi:YadA C-terminal domain-containing protein [Vibrio sp. THAF190c]|uniref:YadA C-terminal domain-containing protein n=1 Tax=Vibrio sp. THAF190c TaxID=2587865 RepID=UPI001267D977|nr:YadA C-terminal domain-containing protein [Vibrio sp. THAF190c]QFT12082.1 hypothetical protein FIV04_19315 [Vibrio sp. THAF190c]